MRRIKSTLIAVGAAVSIICSVIFGVYVFDLVYSRYVFSQLTPGKSVSATVPYWWFSKHRELSYADAFTGGPEIRMRREVVYISRFETSTFLVSMNSDVMVGKQALRGIP